VVVVDWATWTFRITSSNESGLTAANAETVSPKAQNPSVRNVLINLLMAMGCPNARPENRISG
jgi:hypothetical protein